MLKFLSFLSLHVPLSEHWLRTRQFDLRGATRILDAGCGAGQLTGHLRKYADVEASITACDLSAEMLLRAKDRLPNPSVQFVLGDIAQLPFANATFDCVTCGYALEHLEDARSGLAELARVLKLGGRMLLLTTEDRWTGHLTARVWNCRTYNREEFRRRCHEQGLIWKQELSFSAIHRHLGMGGICVEMERQEVESTDSRRDDKSIRDDARCAVSPLTPHSVESFMNAQVLGTGG
jgi:ubiquinone/menaquinone biosynthesis C-methylase UbiE